MICVIDSGVGNLRSVTKAVEALGYEVKLTNSSSDILSAEKVILPGVGEFSACVNGLRDNGIFDTVKEYIQKKKLLLGICVGFQMLFESSEESKDVLGLGVFKGQVRRFSNDLIVPHMGWNSIDISQDNDLANKLFKDIKNGSFFYFAHSYYVDPLDDKLTIAKTNYGKDFVSSIAKENVFAVQFHPEKSQALGLKLLDNFLSL